MAEIYISHNSHQQTGPLTNVRDLRGDRSESSRRRICANISLCMHRLHILDSLDNLCERSSPPPPPPTPTEFELLGALPCWFALQQCRAEAGFLVTHLIPSPHILVFMTSPVKAAGHKMAALTIILFSRLLNVRIRNGVERPTCGHF